MVIAGLIGLPSIVRSSSSSSSSFYKPVFAQPSSSSTPAAATQSNRPNVLLIVGDDFGWSDIGVFGIQISTLNFNALAKDGYRPAAAVSAVLMNYHTIPVCSPASYIENKNCCAAWILAQFSRFFSLSLLFHDVK